MDLKGLRKRGKLVVTCLALFIVAFVWCGCGGEVPEGHSDSTAFESERRSGIVSLKEDTQKQLGIQVAQVEMRKLSRQISLTGVVEPNARRVATIRPLTRGRLQSVQATVGDRVNAGQALAIYDDIELGDLIAQRAAARAALQRAESEAAVAREAVERAQHLVEIGALARAEKQRRVADSQQARSRIEEAQTEVEQIDQKIRRLRVSRQDLEERSHNDLAAGASPLLTPITSPFNGIVTEASAAEGEVIDPASILFRIADISTVWVQGNLYEKDMGLVHRAQKAVVKVIAYPDRTYEGQITYISDFLDPASRTAQVRCEVSNPDIELKVGMFATVQISWSEGPAVTALPASAIQRMNDQPVVFVRQTSNQFQKRVLRTGRRGGNWVEVLDGVLTGEMIVIEGSFQLKAILLRGSLSEED